MGTNYPVDFSVCQLKVKLSKHYLSFLTLRTLQIVSRDKYLPREATAA